jgi:hypothetical protein
MRDLRSFVWALTLSLGIGLGLVQADEKSVAGRQPGKEATMPAATVQVTVHADNPVNTRFGGIGFHVFDHLSKTTQRERDEVIVKLWRELNPSFARLTHQWNWDWESVVPYFKRLRDDTHTEIYLTTWDPQPTKTSDERAAYARRVADMIERLVNKEGLSNIKTYCMTNELSLGEWASLTKDLPTFKDYHRLIHQELQARKLPVGLLATDASPLWNWTTLQWAAENMDDLTEVYGGHHYITQPLTDTNFYPWFLKEVEGGTKLAQAKGKPFIVGEFGSGQYNGPPRDGKRWDGCRWFDTPEEPLVAIQLSEAAVAMMNAGVYACGYWTFADFPDDASTTYANKWGVFRWSGQDHSIRPHYWAWALLTRYFRGPAAVLGTESSEPLVRVAAVRHEAGRTWSVALVNRRGSASPVRLTLEKVPDGTLVRKFVYNPAQVPTNPFGDLPGPAAELTVKDGGLDDTLAATSLTVYTTAFDSKPPAAVKGLTVTTISTGDRKLSWQASTDPDLCYYRVYAGSRQLGSTVATEFLAAADADKGGATFRIVAVDRSGNAGP